MPLLPINAENLELDTIGQLRMDSQWAARYDREEVTHFTDVHEIGVVPASVLYWDHYPDRSNSLKRFGYMLGLRAVAQLSSVHDYQQSLEAAVAAVDAPLWPKRKGVLLKLAGRYIGEQQDYPITRLATSTARILFRYEPPRGDRLVRVLEHIREHAI